MKVKFRATSPDGDTTDGVIGKLSKGMSDRMVKWIVYGYIVDRNRREPLGWDPNDCSIEIERVPT